MADSQYAVEVAPVAPNKSILGTIVIVFAALVAGGAGAYFALKPVASADQAVVDKRRGTKLPAQFVKLDPPFVVNFEARSLVRFLQVTVEVMARDEQTVDLIKKVDPIIRNDLILLFANQRYETISTREGKEQLRADALRVVQDIVDSEGGDGSKVEQLYFTSFVMQ